MATTIKASDGLEFNVKSNWLCSVRMSIKNQARAGLPATHYNKTEVMLISSAKRPSNNLLEQKVKQLLEDKEELLSIIDFKKELLFTLDPVDRDTPQPQGETQ